MVKAKNSVKKTGKALFSDIADSLAISINRAFIGD